MAISSLDTHTLTNLLFVAFRVFHHSGTLGYSKDFKNGGACDFFPSFPHTQVWEAIHREGKNQWVGWWVRVSREPVTLYRMGTVIDLIAHSFQAAKAPQAAHIRISNESLL